MESKFKKYFENMPKIFIVAAVMDPRIKLEAVHMLLEGISDNLMITLPSRLEVDSLLTDLYASYESKFASTTMTTSTTTVPLPSTNSNDPSWSLISKKGKSASSRSELVKYLEIEHLSKRVLDEKRSRLAPDILDCLLCLKDWENAHLGIQTKSAKDELRDYFSDSDIDGDD
ncbi:hypothetical protein RHMOL_Rhmol01G0220200 [Rhododendron molle]|uniref:Uncharacterized protein n=1 Tax=Rhododendron molle TaxID=49168 RepID=A0ACC0Q658_RHOML|nr:hypothetical protein RHMOL_Rhmol01G0220200 [Rhododendron molle]